MSQGLQAVIAAVAITFLFGIFFGIHVLFRRFVIRDHIKKAGMANAQAAEDKRRHKKLRLKKRAG